MTTSSIPDAKPSVQILYFAGAADVVGKRQEIKLINKELSTTAELLLALKREYPALSENHLRIAVNEEFVRDDHPLTSGDVVALIPPVCGG